MTEANTDLPYGHMSAKSQNEPLTGSGISTTCTRFSIDPQERRRAKERIKPVLKTVVCENPVTGLGIPGSGLQATLMRDLYVWGGQPLKHRSLPPSVLGEFEFSKIGFGLCAKILNCLKLDKGSSGLNESPMTSQVVLHHIDFRRKPFPA